MEERTVQVYRNDQWETIESLTEIQAEETFRMYEPDGEPVENREGETMFVAKVSGFVGPNGLEMVRVY